ncbi:MAG TPA: DUF4344 domain-containing metallopeptidase [Terriglobia bacterium]|nr:DUF4344 domain-containing metallopeptidase [Terriglobia bacterium]
MNGSRNRQPKWILLPVAIAAVMAIAAIAPAPAAAQSAAGSAGAKMAPDTAAPGSPGSDDGDGGANDDPVWGYFLGKTAYVFFREIAGAMRLGDGKTLLAETPDKRDQLTALFLIAESGKRFGGAVLGDAAVGWMLSWRQDQLDDAADAAAPTDNWDSMNLKPRQISDLLCALYGSDPVHFHNLVDNGDLKADMAPGCIQDFAKLTAQWSTTLAHAGMRLALPNAALGASDTAVAGMDLEQRPSTASNLADFTGWLNDVGLLGNLVAETNRDLSVVAPLKLIVLQCKKNNDVASQKADQEQLPGDLPGETHLCYEWLKSGYDAATAQNVEAPPE